MLALEAPIKARLLALPELTNWDVRGATEHADRSVVPAVDVRCAGASTADRRSGAVQLAPEWQITLVLRRGSDAATQIDAALDAVIASLHGWQPGQHGGRGWEPMVLTRITDPQFSEDGLTGYELAFTTGATYKGQQ